MKNFNSSINCISCIVCVVCILYIPSIALAQLKDDFSDGNFSTNPAWTGDTSHFEVNSSGQLHLKSTGSDTSVLVTQNGRVLNTEWNFWLKLSFNTSSNNFARVYLTSDTNKLYSGVNGYFLQVGGGEDSVLIMKQTGKTFKTVFRFNSYKTLHSTNTLRFKITRDDSGNWEAMIDTTGGYNYIPEGSFFDDSFVTSRWFGLMCRYTSSNATKFYFDDFYVGPIIYDTIRPEILSVEAISASVIRMVFSEPIQHQSAENVENYRLISKGLSPDSVKQDILQPDVVSIFLHDSLVQGTIDSVNIRNILDLSGNRLTDTIVQLCYYQPGAYDILIHEIMADPDPPVELPNGEFVELYNRSAFTINLKDWKFRYGSYSKVFPSTTLSAGGYLLIVKDSAYLNYARCAVLFTSSSSLSNEGTSLVIEDSMGHVIHAVEYSPNWYRGSFKGEGGWSLEMTDPLNPCGCLENWEPSKDATGGTPGRANAVMKANPDEKSPAARRAVIIDSTVVEVTFSEAMDSLSLLSENGWVVVDGSDGAIHPVVVKPVSPEFISTKLLFEKSFERGVTYTLKISGTMRDCAGNNCDTSRSIRFAIPDSATSRDVVINEVLSNPTSGGSRFVELYNRSEKIIDLQTLVLANRDTAAGLSENATPLISSGYLLFPGDYVAMTSSAEDIDDRYRPAFPEAIQEMKGFPVFGDDTGTVVIARKDNLVIIDKIQYNPDMHYPLLATTEGVSLERTSPDLSSEDQSNWHSAAETAGFATPGYQNSHWVVPDDTDQGIVIQPAIFSPDNDGRDDLLIVTIRQNEPDFTVSIAVFDSRGQMVKQIANNVLTGNEGIFTWDGMTATRNKASLGIYVLLIELVQPEGTVRKVKRTVILGGRL